MNLISVSLSLCLSLSTYIYVYACIYIFDVYSQKIYKIWKRVPKCWLSPQMSEAAIDRLITESQASNAIQDLLFVTGSRLDEPLPWPPEVYISWKLESAGARCGNPFRHSDKQGKHNCQVPVYSVEHKFSEMHTKHWWAGITPDMEYFANTGHKFLLLRHFQTRETI